MKKELKTGKETVNMITHELLRSWAPCANGFKRYCELFPNGTDLQTAIEGLVNDGHDEWAHWLFNQCRDRKLFDEITLRGYRNSGDLNSGDLNSGDLNSGDLNSGDLNSGYRNSGDRNSGYRNSGDRNSGDLNSGDRNSGYRNSGDRNSGDLNSGDLNSGDLNSGNYNVGFFNSITPEEISVFNKPCNRKIWDDAHKPRFLYFSLTEWIFDSQMTDQEKIENPKFFVAEGYLKTLEYKEAFKNSWNAADPEDRIRVKDLPNFDPVVFTEISGIEIQDDGAIKPKKSARKP